MTRSSTWRTLCVTAAAIGAVVATDFEPPATGVVQKCQGEYYADVDAFAVDWSAIVDEPVEDVNLLFGRVGNRKAAICSNSLEVDLNDKPWKEQVLKYTAVDALKQYFATSVEKDKHLRIFLISDGKGSSTLEEFEKLLPKSTDERKVEVTEQLLVENKKDEHLKNCEKDSEGNCKIAHVDEWVCQKGYQTFVVQMLTDGASKGEFDHNLFKKINRILRNCDSKYIVVGSGAVINKRGTGDFEGVDMSEPGPGSFEAYVVSSAEIGFRHDQKIDAESPSVEVKTTDQYVNLGMGYGNNMLIDGCQTQLGKGSPPKKVLMIAKDYSASTSIRAAKEKEMKTVLIVGDLNQDVRTRDQFLKGLDERDKPHCYVEKLNDLAVMLPIAPPTEAPVPDEGIVAPDKPAPEDSSVRHVEYRFLEAEREASPLPVAAADATTPKPKAAECTKEIMKKIKAFALDLDGTIYNPNGLLSGADTFLSSLRKRKIPFVLLSNGIRSKEKVSEKFETLYNRKKKEDDAYDKKIKILDDEVHTAGLAIAQFIKDEVTELTEASKKCEKLRLFLIGTAMTYCKGPGETDCSVENIKSILETELKEVLGKLEMRSILTDDKAKEWAKFAREQKKAEKETCTYIVHAFDKGAPKERKETEGEVGAYKTLDYPLMKKVTMLARNYAKYVVAAPDVVDSQPSSEIRKDVKPPLDMAWPTTGGFEQYVKVSVEGVEGVDEYQFGTGKGGNKGDEYMMKPALALLRKQIPDLKVGEVMMVGDNYGTDIKAGNAASMKTLLVESGAHKSTAATEEYWDEIPTCYLKDVEAIIELLPTTTPATDAPTKTVKPAATAPMKSAAFVPGVSFLAIAAGILTAILF